MTHHTLITDLASTFDLSENIVIEEPPLGSKHLENNVGVPDLFVMRKSYTRPEIRIYEVKASTADLRGDLRKGKWLRYLPFADRMYFALGPEVDEKSLYPENVGIMKRGPKGWKTLKPAPRNPERKVLPETVLFSLMMNGRRRNYYDRLSRLEREHAILLKKEIKDIYGSQSLALRKMAEALKEREQALEHVKEDARKQVIKEMREELGLKYRWGSEDLRGLFTAMVWDEVENAFRGGVKKLREHVDGPAVDAPSSSSPTN